MDLYESIYRRDGYRCVYCGKYLLEDFDSWFSIHTDHLVPASKNGPESEENLVTSCGTCNILKGQFEPNPPYTTETRLDYIQRIREYIFARRVERMPRFFSLIEQINSDVNNSGS